MNILNEIKQKIKISDLTPLKKVSGALKGDCPFHSSSSKNSFISYDNDGFKCFSGSCKGNKGGNIFSFVMLQDGCDFKEALHKLATKAGIEIKQLTEDEKIVLKHKQEQKETFLNVTKAFIELCSTRLNLTCSGSTIEKILVSRGFSKETVKEYYLGYCPVGSSVVDELLKEFTIEQLYSTGLFKFNESKKLIPKYEGRIVIPYLKNGLPVYSIARKTENTPTNGGVYCPKYIKQSSKNEEFLADNSYFYGEDSLNSNEDVIICEGVLDCLSLIQVGVSSISPVTTKFRKQDHSRMLELVKGKSRVFIVNDNEGNEEGLKGAVQTAQFLFRNSVNVFIGQIPKPEGVDKIDWNDYLMGE
jgi:DNA primase